MLRKSIDGNFCASPDLDLDPVFNRIRATPEFQKIRQDAIQCQERFLQWRAQNAP